MRTYTMTIFDVEYTYRGLTRGEALELLKEQIPEWEKEDRIVAKTVLFCINANVKIPGDQILWENTLAGVVTTLFHAIAEASGITEQGAANFTNEVQTWIGTPAGRAEMLMMGICGLTINQIHAFDPVEWFYHAAAATTLYDLQNDPQKGMTEMNMPPQNMPPTARSLPRNEISYVPEQTVSIRGI